MLNRIPAAVSASFAALALTSCFTLSNPFNRDPKPVPEKPGARQPIEKPVPPAKPAKPVEPVAEVNAFYETETASTAFFVSRPQSERSDRLPDKLLRRGTVVQVLAPKAGAGWSKVRLENAQTGYIPLTDLNIVGASQRPSGFSAPRGPVDIGPLDLPPAPDPTPPSFLNSEPIDDINLDDPDGDVPSAPPAPSLPENTDDIGIDDLPGF